LPRLANPAAAAALRLCVNGADGDAAPRRLPWTRVRTATNFVSMDMTEGRTVLAQARIDAQAKYRIGQVVRHRVHPFRGVIFDVDPVFANTDEWWNSIPEDHRPSKNQPFYHLLAENETSYYHAYVSEQNLLPDDTGEPVDHPEVEDFFGDLHDGQYDIASIARH
jgi:heat shock protein HspQ